MRTARIVGLAVVMTMVFAACSGDDDDAAGTGTEADATTGGGDGDARAYADAFSDSLQQDGDDAEFSAEQADCIGPKFVDTIGVERLQEAGVTPADVASGADLDFSELGLTDDEGNDLYDAFGACDVDLRDTLVGAMVADGTATDEFRACLDDGFTDDVVRDFFVTAMVDGADAGQSDTGASLNAILTTCLGSQTGSLPVTTND